MLLKTIVYYGNSLEVELLMTGKKFKRNEPVDVTDEEYEAVIYRDDFKNYQSKSDKKTKKGDE